MSQGLKIWVGKCKMRHCTALYAAFAAAGDAFYLAKIWVAYVTHSATFDEKVHKPQS
jgi:hypothetical protein